MKSDPTEIHVTRSAARRVARPPRPARPPKSNAHPGTDAKPNKSASPAAMDEIFAGLARNVERIQPPHARAGVDQNRNVADVAATTAPTPTTPTDIGTIPIAPRPVHPDRVDPAALRRLDAEMDRQRQRLAQLLRDIDGATAAD